MFKLLATVFLILPLLTAAKPMRRDDTASSCSSGTLTCCEDYSDYDSSTGRTIIKLAGLQDHPAAYYGRVGADCTTGVGILDGSYCDGTPVCCSTSDGVVSIGCVSVDL